MFKLLTIALLILSSPAFAEEKLGQKFGQKFGLAMVGEPKYNARSPSLDYANPRAPKGGTLRQAATGSFDTLNPYSIKGRAPEGMSLVFGRLMARVWDEPFTMYPQIAQSVEVPEDRSSITFHLNPAAKFHDGTAITTEDVLFSYSTLKAEGRPNMRQIYKLATPKVIDKKTIKFSFNGDYDRETVMIMAMMPVLSKAYWSGKAFDKTTLKLPLGSGPYKILSAEPGKRIVYERVKDYWGKNLLVSRGHHNFDKVVYEYFRDDTVAFESFKKGDLDLRREWDAGNWNSTYDFPALKEGKIAKENLKHGRPDKVRGFIFNTRRFPFDDIRVRQALNLFFDFDWVNKNLFYDQYNHIDSFYPNTDLAREVAKAPVEAPKNLREKLRMGNELLEEAGWTIRNGKRTYKKSGKSMSFEILLDNPDDEKIALSLSRSLKKMGIEANVRVLDSAAFRGRLNDYNYDMILHYWFSTLSPGTEQNLYWSCAAAKEPSRWNYAGICDPKIDALAKSIPTARSRQELAAKTQQLDRRLWEGTYMIPLYHNPVDFVAYWKHLKHPTFNPLYGMVIETWWMDKASNP